MIRLEFSEVDKGYCPICECEISDKEPTREVEGVGGYITHVHIRCGQILDDFLYKLEESGYGPGL